MGLQTIHIRNYKCIKDYKISLKQLTILLGENGSGKTNILSALQYFYNNMISQQPLMDVFDENNTLNDQVEITLTYDLSKLLIRSRRNKKEEKNKYQNYYKVIEKMGEQKVFSLTLTQIKGGRITWNHGIDKRQAIYHMFPLYQLDAREINLVDWEILWKNIGDLLKPSSEEREMIEEEIKKTVKKQGSQLNGQIDLLERIFQQLQIKPIKFSVSEFSATMAELYYGGRSFSYSEHKLNSFSNGTNSYNYISLMLFVLNAMGRTKMKEPILLMDEPEISLHFHMVDELVNEIFACLDDIIVVIATHSPRVVKNVLIKEKGNCTVYQVYKRGYYSYLCLLRMFSREEKREKFFLNDNHANAFFARLLILVEGETEIELLSNSYLKILFPVLKEAEIIKGMSDKVVYRIVDTTTRHYNVPMFALLDMDKILEWHIGENRMEWKKDYQYVADKEVYYYGRKRNETLSLRKRIIAMCNKCKFSYRLPLFGCNDSNFEELIGLVQRYYQNYNIFPVKTTIEGTLINVENYHYIVEYLKHIKKWNLIEKAYSMLYHKIDKVNFLRLLFSGKSDLLLKASAIVSSNTHLYNELKDALNHPIRKTDWVSEWIKFYFSIQTNICIEHLTEAKFLDFCENSDNLRKLRSQFYADFVEFGVFLNSIIQLYNI